MVSDEGELPEEVFDAVYEKIKQAGGGSHKYVIVLQNKCTIMYINYVLFKYI